VVTITLSASEFRFGAAKNLKVPTKVSPAKRSDDIAYQQYAERPRDHGDQTGINFLAYRLQLGSSEMMITSTGSLAVKYSKKVVYQGHLQ